MTRKYLIMAVANSKKKVLDIFSEESTARKMLFQYKVKGMTSLYIKQVSTH